jgi:hypothetical protein
VPLLNLRVAMGKAGFRRCFSPVSLNYEI